MPTTETKLRRGTAAQCDAFTPVEAEVVVDLTNDRLRVGDAVKVGGYHVPNHNDVQKQTFTYGTVTGTANAILLANIPVVAAYVNGLKLSFKATATNSAATTVNIDGLGIKNIYKLSGTSLVALTGNEIVNGAIYDITYDGTQFQLTNGAGVGTTVTQQVFTSSGTYTPTSGTRMVRVQQVGGGGSASSDSNNGGSGGNTTFGAYMTAGGGVGGTIASKMAGGTATGGTINIEGQAALNNTLYGGDSVLGFGGVNAAGGIGVNGTGYGSGGSCNINTGVKGNGAGAGYCERIFTAAEIGASQVVTIGAAGTGASGSGGGLGTAGICIITEYR